jgi:hypothetical protein
MHPSVVREMSVFSFPAVTLKNCAFPSTVYLWVLCTCHSSSLSGQSTDHCELHISACEMAMKRMGMLGVSVRQMKSLIMEMEMVTLIGEGR